jgi:hypothetical protein
MLPTVTVNQIYFKKTIDNKRILAKFTKTFLKKKLCQYNMKIVTLLETKKMKIKRQSIYCKQKKNSYLFIYLM